MLNYIFGTVSIIGFLLAMVGKLIIFFGAKDKSLSSRQWREKQILSNSLINYGGFIMLLFAFLWFFITV